MKTSRFDVEDYENEDVLLYNQALENSRRETKRVHVAVPDAPTFYPSLQEFKDPLKYIARSLNANFYLFIFFVTSSPQYPTISSEIWFM